MWPSSARQINYGLTPEMNMVGVGLRDLFVVAPASSFHQDSSTISFDPLHAINNSNAAAATAQGLGVGVGVGLIPLLAATPCLPQPTTTAAAPDEDVVNTTRAAAVANLLKCGGSAGGGGGGSDGEIGGGGGSGSVCRDCGNQAKKDCGHGRCRTCCKSRGFDCATHVKSTWVPATRRRDRQSTSSSTKKPRLITCQTATASEHTSTSNTTTPRSFDTSSCHQDASFKESLPEQVQASAMFKCMRFTAIEDGDDEFAYEAIVKIGGHVFKGVLYDRGVAPPKDGFPNIADLHLGGNNGCGSTRVDHV